MLKTWQRVKELDEVAWPVDAVLICDRAMVSRAPRDLADRLIAVDAGEGLKTLAAVEALASRVLELRSSRPLCLIGMGGGSVGDAVGFLASILWRGVDLWHVPTTLLAAVDSAHGGKTAVNLADAKNQLGTFWPAQRTIFADSFLETMPIGLRTEGLTELVKALWLGDAIALDVVDEVGIAELAFAPYRGIAEPLGALVDAAVAVKQRIVEQDPHELRGIRTWLNLGHTVAHGLELTCHTPHGVAVAWGLACMALVSAERGLLDDATAQRLLRHVAPLMGSVPLAPTREAFTRAVSRDKKSSEGRLRSVLLGGSAVPVVVDDVDSGRWFGALERARRDVFDAPVHMALRAHRSATLRMSASKSELNRALVIAAMRGEHVSFEADSHADDVEAMRAGIAALTRDETANAGDGGTTFRFLTAVAVCRPNGGRIRIGRQLSQRPHAGLLDALREAGVTVTQEGDTFTFGPLPAGAVTLRVDASQSSQFASALLMVSVARPDVTVEVAGEAASAGYLQMTAQMLRQEPLRVTPDASSAALWHVINALGGDVTLLGEPSDLQPDSVLPDLLWPRDHTTMIELDIGATPDLVPVLAAYAALSAPAVRLFGAPQLRHKESNRIDDLAAAFHEVGIAIVAGPDGVSIPAGQQAPREGAAFDPRGDHRLAFAAIALCTASPLVLRQPRCVTKSYPAVFADARAAGFVFEPIFGW